jgi:hypothetical protein
MQHGITVRAQREPKNEIARFQALKSENLAISKPAAAKKLTLDQPLSICSRTTGYPGYCGPEFLGTRLSARDPKEKETVGGTEIPQCSVGRLAGTHLDSERSQVCPKGLSVWPMAEWI